MLERVPQQFRELQEITMQTDTRDILAHATRQAESYEDYFLVDIDAHVTETSFWPEILAMIDNDVIRQMGQAIAAGRAAAIVALLNNSPGILYQHVYGRIPHQQALLEKVEKRATIISSSSRAASMDALGLDYQVVFPTPMLTLGMHPQDDIEVALGAAYNKWLVERILPEDDRLKGMIYLPFNTPEACVEEVKKYAGVDSIIGYSVVFDAQQAGASQQLHEALCDDGGDRQAVLVPLRLQLERSVVPAAQSLHLHARAELRALQPDPHDELDHQRAARALPEAEGAVGRERARLDPVPDAAARPRVSDAHLRGAAAEAAAERVHARHVLHQPAAGEDQPRSCWRRRWRRSTPRRNCSMRRTGRTGTSIAPSSITTLPFLSDQAKRNILGLNAARLFNLEVKRKRPKADGRACGAPGRVLTWRSRPRRKRQLLGDDFVAAAERALSAGQPGQVSDAELERVMTAAVRLYAAKAETDRPPAQPITPSR